MPRIEEEAPHRRWRPARAPQGEQDPILADPNLAANPPVRSRNQRRRPRRISEQWGGSRSNRRRRPPPLWCYFHFDIG